MGDGERQEGGGIEIRAIVSGSRRRGSSSGYVIDNTHTLSLGLCCALMNMTTPFQGRRRLVSIGSS